VGLEARKFSKCSYDQNDGYAKDKIKHFLTSRGHEVLEDEENYNHDLKTKKNGMVFFFEFEVKINYPFTSEEDYKFSTVSFLGRKIRLHNINPFYYLILCYETDYVVFCHSSKIFNEEYKESLTLNTHDRKGGDEMYRVPKEICGFFSI
jgi:hypothetical protein